ncbi:MAG: NmrA/HSCARG family protein [Ferruginibacter sp.]
MSIIKTIFVTGATGNQGGAVIRNLYEKGFHIKALTRNANSEKAKALVKPGVEVIEGNLNKPGTFSAHLKDIDGVFSVQSFEEGTKKEIQQGIALADYAKSSGVPHFMYSSVCYADMQTGVPHFESKKVVEDHIKSIGLPYTILRPVSMYENFLIPQVRSRILKGKLVSPRDKHTIIPMLAADDIGRIAALAFELKESYTGKTITLASEALDVEQSAAIFSEGMGKEIKYSKLPGLITRLAMGKDLYTMFKWEDAHSSKNGFDIASIRNQFPGMIGLHEWIPLFFK